MKILLIIPAYNEEKSIKKTIASIQKMSIPLDYIVINDCSTDRTEHILKEEGFSYINLPVNLGIGGGVQTGYKYAAENGYDIAIQLDGDGQHNPCYIEKLIEPIINGQAEMVIGSRFIEKNGFQSSMARRAGIGFIRFVIKSLTGKTIFDTTSGFRACSRQLIEFFAAHYDQDYPEPEAIVSAILNGYRVCEVAVEMNERQGGESSIRAFKTVYYMIKVSLGLILYRLSMKRRGRR